MSSIFRLQIWRNISTNTLSVARKGAASRNRKSKPVNPGIDKRLQAFQEAEKGLPEVIEEDIDDLELDMMNTNKGLDEHERELAIRDHIRTMKIVERKYFKKAKEPSMLFWDEKEQIRYLHTEEPEEWDVSRLAKSFPVSEDGVKKILKANWSPQDPGRILKYNETVRKNWKLLEEGKLDVDGKLRLHFMKFVSRAQAKLPPPDSHLAITASQSTSKDLAEKKSKNREGEKFNSHLAITASQSTSKGLAEKKSKIREGEKLSKENNENIQKILKKKGDKNSAIRGTYREGDSHYDVDDGEFLFRVPGMDR